MNIPISFIVDFKMFDITFEDLCITEVLVPTWSLRSTHEGEDSFARKKLDRKETLRLRSE